MGEFEVKQSYHLSMNKEARDRMREIQDHLEENYNGIAHFVRQKLYEEKPLKLDERINRKKKALENNKDELERLKRIKREREEQSQLRDKKELLKEKQKQLRKVQKRESSTRDEVRAQVESKILSNKPPRFSDEEYLNKKEDRIERLVDSRLEKGPKNVDKLVEDVQRLQREVADLNGGQESWFMDLQSVEVS